MAINGLGSNNYNYGNYTQNNVNKIQSTSSTENTVQTKDDLLKELNEIYPDFKITTGNVTEDNYANFAGGTGNYNLVISDKYLEEALTSDEKKEELIQQIQEIKDATGVLKNLFNNRNRELYASGFMITDKGTITSWSSAKVLDPAKEVKGQNSNNKSLMDRLDNNREQRKLEEQQREERRLEKRDIERREQKKEDEKRLEEKREAKRMEEKRQLERINNEDILNSNMSKVVVDTYKKDINFENNLSDFNTEI